MMNFNNKLPRFEDEEEPAKELPENPMEKMMGGMMFDKKFIEHHPAHHLLHRILW